VTVLPAVFAVNVAALKLRDKKRVDGFVDLYPTAERPQLRQQSRSRLPAFEPIYTTFPLYTSSQDVRLRSVASSAWRWP
jgi:hypothetical protein